MADRRVPAGRCHALGPIAENSAFAHVSGLMAMWGATECPPAYKSLAGSCGWGLPAEGELRHIGSVQEASGSRSGNPSRIADTKRAVKPVTATSPEPSRPACAGV